MATANRTKKAYADALKQLLPFTPIEKIYVAQLCEICGLHRKSFYYHFQDKYDLLNWTFKTEIIEPLMKEEYEGFYQFMDRLIHRIDEERKFYEAAFRTEKLTSFGNTFASSFQDFFIEQIKFFIGKYHPKAFVPSTSVTPQQQMNYYLDTLGGSIMGNIQQWLLEKPKLSADQYAQLMITTKAL